MKIAQFFMPKKRRLILIIAGAILVCIALGAFAHDGRGREHRGYGKSREKAWLDRGGFDRGGETGGYIGPVVTASEAQTLENKTPVRLQGTIDKALKDGRYEFHDESGIITVEIRRRAWNGVTVNAGDKVEITGWIRKSFFESVVLVKQVTRNGG